MRPTPVLSVLSLLLLAGQTSSQETLSLNGAASATLPPGGILVAAATLPPGTPAVIAYDESPGPFDLFGELIPLGLTPALGAVGPAGIVPESGIFVNTVTVPDNVALVGLDFYLCGLALDPNDPNGLALTTGAVLAVRIASNAGSARTGFTGESIVLDGGANASAGGALAAGDSIEWNIVSKPVGSVAALVGETTLYPRLTPDLPGQYGVEATLKKGLTTLDSHLTTITALHASALSIADGDIEPGDTISLGGVLSPASHVASARLDGTPLSIAPDGSFLVPALPWIPDQLTRPIRLEVTTTSGEVAVKQLTVLHGTPDVTAAAVASAMQLQITATTFSDVCAAIQASMTSSQFGAAVNGPAVTYDASSLGISFGSLTIDPTGGSFSSHTVTSTPTNSNVLVTSTVTNAKINFNFSGSVLFIPFSTTGAAAANVVIKNRVTFSTPAVGVDAGKLKVTVTVESVTISDLALNLGSLPGLITNVVSGIVSTIYTNSLQGTVKAQVQAGVDAVMDDFEVLLTQFTVSLEKQYSQSIAFTSVVHSSLGVTCHAKTDLTPNSPPTGPALSHYVAGAGQLGAFGSTVPGMGVPYHWGVGVKADAVNALLAKLTSGGFVNGDYDVLAGQLGLSFGSVVFTASELAAWLPTAGFERLPASQLVKVVLEPTVAPVVKCSASEAKFSAELAGIKAKFITKAPGSQDDVEFLTLYLESKSVLNIDKASAKKIELSVESKSEKGSVVKGMPSAKGAAASAGAKKFAEILTPLVMRGLQNLSLPGYSKAGAYSASSQLKVGPLGAAGSASWNKFQ